MNEPATLTPVLQAMDAIASIETDNMRWLRNAGRVMDERREQWAREDAEMARAEREQLA